MDLGLLLKHTAIQSDRLDTTQDEGAKKSEVVDEHVPEKDTSQVSFSDKPEIIEPGKDKDVRFKKPWNKLEKGMKLNRLLIFIEKETEEHTLSPGLKKELKNLLFKACDGGYFNKISEVSYDVDEACINSIKSLEFNSDTKRYKIKSGSSKHRSTSKSKSNIDRLLKPKSRTQ